MNILERDCINYKMQCQLCASFGDARFDFDGLPMENLTKHSKIHQLQIDRIWKEDTKPCSREQHIFKHCFPNFNAVISTKSLNVETEITGRRRRAFLNEQDGNNGSSKKKRRIRDDLEETRQETARTAEKSGAIPPQRTPQQQTIKSGSCHGRSIAALRSHCRELNRKFGQNGKMTCRQCSTTIVATNITNALDHVTRFHFGRKLYACRLCSKRFTAHGSLVRHSTTFHQISSKVTFIDLSKQYENEIMELITMCYGTTTNEEDTPKNVAIANNSGEYVVTIAITRCFRQLKQKFAKLTCRICANHYGPVGGLDAVSHIGRVHFEKSLFTCRLCSNGFCYYDGIKHHLRRRHGKGASGNYDCHMEQYEKEIIEWMRTCFGEAEKIGEQERQAGVQHYD